MKVWIGVVALAGAVVCGPASAQGGDGNDLLEYCKEAINEQATFFGGFCYGTMRTIGTLVRSINLDVVPNHKICPPPNATVTQYARITVKYLEEHPEQLHMDGVNLSIMALQTAFPCKT